MRSGRWTKAILAAALAATACKAPAGEPESGQRPLASATEKAPEKTTANADSEGEPDQPLTSGRWSLVDVQVVLANTEVAGLQPAAMADRLRDDLRLAGIARAADETGPAHEAAQLGVELAWQRLLASGEPADLAAAATDGWLEVAALAQAEQRPAPGKKRGNLAERRTTARLPLPATHWALPDAFLTPRLSRVAEQAATDSLGQLWAHSQPTATLVPLLTEREVWRVSAAVRELGERRHTKATAAIYKLIADSRREVSVVALAAAGRLAQPGAVAAIQAVLEQPDSAEQLDAALVALADLRDGPEGAAATQLLQLQAQASPVPLVRLRARHLLDSR